MLQSINWQSRIIATLATVFIVASLNANGVLLPTIALMASGLLLYQLPGLVTDLVGGVLNLGGRVHYAWSAALLLCLIPGSFALWELGGFGGWLLNGGFVVGSIVGTVVLGLLFSKLREHLRLDLSALLITSLQVVVLFLLVHIQEETLSGLEEETFKVRILAYVGTALVSVAVAFVGSFRIAAMRSSLDAGWRTTAAVLMSFGLGALLLYADRNYFVGRYFWYHVFLFAGGALSLEGAFTIALSRLKSRPVTAFASLAMLALTSTVIFFFLGPVGKDMVVRSEAENLRAGQLVLAVLPSHNAEVGPGEHIALMHQKFHDYKPEVPEYNVLLITIDTLRKDYVGPNAPHNAASPTLTKFAAESTNFENAYAPSSHTAVSMGSTLYGKYSANLEWRLWVRYKNRLYHPDRISEEFREKIGTRHQYTTVPEPTDGGILAERLQAAGLYTMATPYLATAPFFRSGVGYEQGFDQYKDYQARFRKLPTSKGIIKDSLKQIDAAKGKRWFQWTHLFDPHSSKANHKRYAQLVKHTDDGVALFFEELKKRGYWENTIIVITSDHGEQMNKHGKKHHGVSLYNEEVLVPLIIRVPGSPPRALKAPASVIDIVPTLASLVGGDLSGLDGVNLAPFILEGRYPEGRPVFTELHRYLKRSRTPNYDEKAVVLGPHKLIHNRKTGTYQLFDLESDPGETKNLIGTLPETKQNLIALLQAFVGPAEEKYPLPGL